jgi:hypothetical protein
MMKVYLSQSQISFISLFLYSFVNQVGNMHVADGLGGLCHFCLPSLPEGAQARCASSAYSSLCKVKT